ncbi:HU family DNA-binding protein [Parabacteroides timonensis]|uniref:HU family DNA-binding protein n=1 Tax=Parabacteroides timonensis TaxID=1871013 RepID=UPI00094ECD46|nr:HU family DNA-binding protein [Parabacteroides timonensis]
MPAVYRMEKNPPKKGASQKVVLHPRIIPRGTVSTEEVIEEASSRSTYSRGDLQGAVRLIADVLKKKLKDGYNVSLDGIGYFSVSLQSRPVEDKKELRSESVDFKNVNFRCCAQLKRELKTMRLERYKEPQKAEFSEEEKERRLFRYLDRNAYITTLVYQGLMGCTEYMARKELKQFVADGLLMENGTRRMCIYVKPPEPEELPDTLVVESNIRELQPG